ncbi:MAG: enoyl-ACP reductase FabI [Candidatus Puniceispirillales bacterium]
MSLLAGKNGLIMGVANDHSIAYGIAQHCARAGASLAFTYQNDMLAKRVNPLAESLGSDLTVPCDVSVEGGIDTALDTLAKSWNQIDFIVHAVAFADKNELRGAYLNTSRENFTSAMMVSCYSLTELARAALPFMKDQGGSLMTLSYLGANRITPNYNVMGVAKAALEASVRYLAADLGSRNIRVNSLSAGPVKTLAASGIGDFRYILKWNAYNSPLKRNVSLEDIGGAGVYLLSDLSSGVTGETHHVDCGYHVVGMKAVDAPDISVETSDG